MEPLSAFFAYKVSLVWNLTTFMLLGLYIINYMITFAGKQPIDRIIL